MYQLNVNNNSDNYITFKKWNTYLRSLIKKKTHWVTEVMILYFLELVPSTPPIPSIFTLDIYTLHTLDYITSIYTAFFCACVPCDRSYPHQKLFRISLNYPCWSNSWEVLLLSWFMWINWPEHWMSSKFTATRNSWLDALLWHGKQSPKN